MTDNAEFKRLAQAAVGKSYISSDKFWFQAEATPERVLALLAELEVSINVGRALAETIESVCESRDALSRAVDQLRAENERIERNRDMWKGQVERQAEELTSLRKDAERYRWLMSSAVMNGTLGIQDGWIDFEFKDEAQEQIDAALGQGEKS